MSRLTLAHVERHLPIRGGTSAVGGEKDATEEPGTICDGYAVYAVSAI